MVTLVDRVTGVLVFDGRPETVGVVDGSTGGGVLVFDGAPTVGAITRKVVAGVAVVSTTGPRGAQGIQGEQGLTGLTGLNAYELAVLNGYAGTEQEYLDSLRFFVTVAPGQDPPAGTPDRTFVFEEV